jgi:hypothetical protein
VWVYSIPAVARRGQFWAGQALLGVRVVPEHMPAVGKKARRPRTVRLPQHHVTQHFHFAPAAAFGQGGGDGRVSRRV